MLPLARVREHDIFASKDETNVTTVDASPASTSTDTPPSSAQALRNRRRRRRKGTTTLSTTAASTDKGKKHCIVRREASKNGEAKAVVEAGTSGVKLKLFADVVSEAKHESKTDGKEEDTDTGTCFKEKPDNVDPREKNGEKNGETMGQKRPSPKRRLTQRRRLKMKTCPPRNVAE